MNISGCEEGGLKGERVRRLRRGLILRVCCDMIYLEEC